MIVSNITCTDLVSALVEVNTKYANNIKFKSGSQFLGNTRDGKNKFRLTRSVVATRAKKLPGQKRGAILPGVVVHNSKLVAAACWHVHGDFMDALLSQASIHIGREKLPHHPGDAWQDYNVESQAIPLYASEAYNCNGTWEEK
jgi:hypothetical protein